jgi:predicted nucleic acid-binding protein
MKARGDVLLTSALCVGEVLVKPLEREDQAIYARYCAFFRSSAVTVIPFADQAALHYAAIRKDRSISKPDAIQLACAASAGIDLLITNDERLSRTHVPGVSFIASLARAPL